MWHKSCCHLLPIPWLFFFSIARFVRTKRTSILLHFVCGKQANSFNKNKTYSLCQCNWHVRIKSVRTERRLPHQIGLFIAITHLTLQLQFQFLKSSFCTCVCVSFVHSCLLYCFKLNKLKCDATENRCKM